ncbi:hypothetical protein M422DRAFT_201968 [Sphaerobolus stellatus SS14]|nr:hypothetical protein M422DRAFT_201968 [Sphaerobolus stellatus SS14]
MASSVTFPSDPQDPFLSPQAPSTPTRPPYLPFRRISLPTPPHLNSSNRISVASITSFDSTPEEGQPATPKLIRNFKSQQKSRIPSSPSRQFTRRRSSHLKLAETEESMDLKIKRRKVVKEILETEHAYVNGLDLIYTHFLTPLISSLETPQPLLGRSELTTLFSNFIDIWNLHRSFYTSLSTHLKDTESMDPPPLSPVLMSHFPYLSLYTPFITSFPTVMSSLSSLMAINPAFSQFIRTQEEDARCGKLGLRDWLLTIVQRCPRYLLLLKDLINCTDRSDPEHGSLTAVHTLLSRITQSLNTSLHEHSQTLSLLSLQRATPNLPFQLIAPGRSLVRRGPLTQGQVERSASDAREFLLFSDCLVWLARIDDNKKEWLIDAGRKPRLRRGHTRSETALATVGNAKRSSDDEERWSFIGRIELVDLEVVNRIGKDETEKTRFDILSPGISFAVYAGNEQERDEWTEALRSAKSSLLVSLNMMHPNSTLTSSEATTHLRRALQALPDTSDDGPTQHRGHVDHFLPAVWVPDSKTESCMRCSARFGWRRRRHHCRLCGRCVCTGCSGKTFFITDSATKDRKPARACNACYETVFPIVKDHTNQNDTALVDMQDGISSSSKAVNLNNFGTLARLPWQSMPAFSAPGPSSTSMSALLRPPPSSFHEPFRPRLRSRPLSHPAVSNFELSSAATSTASINLIAQDPTTSVPDLSRSPPTEEIETLEEEEAEQISEAEELDKKRFSMAALAVDMEPVTTRPTVSGEGRSKRFSLLLGGRSSHKKGTRSQNDGDQATVDHGIAVGKLMEILGKDKRKV